MAIYPSPIPLDPPPSPSPIVGVWNLWEDEKHFFLLFKSIQLRTDS
jgi:hypothetical protein